MRRTAVCSTISSAAAVEYVIVVTRGGVTPSVLGPRATSQVSEPVADATRLAHELARLADLGRSAVSAAKDLQNQRESCARIGTYDGATPTIIRLLEKGVASAASLLNLVIGERNQQQLVIDGLRPQANGPSTEANAKRKAP